VTLLLLPRAAVAEGAGTVEAVVDWGTTGATLGVQILDNQGTVSVSRKTDAITEDPAGSGVYRRDLTAPTTAGWYTIVWDNTTLWQKEALYVTEDILDFTLDASTSAAHTVWAQGFATGLTGTIGVQVLDNQGTVTSARVTTGISEAPAGSGIYLAQITTPATIGLYSVVWDDTTDYVAERLNVGVVTTVPSAVGTLTLASASVGTLTIS
jgi:hypothetical protein